MYKHIYLQMHTYQGFPNSGKGWEYPPIVGEIRNFAGEIFLQGGW